MITQTTEEVSYIDANGNIAYRIGVIFQGDEAANNIVGTDTTDVLYGWGGNDTLDGGDGIDTLDYSGMEDVHGGFAGITVDLPGILRR